MILQVSIGDVTVSFDDDNDDQPDTHTMTSHLESVRQAALITWMALPTLNDTDRDLEHADLEADD